jgi:RecB family exonuclease
MSRDRLVADIPTVTPSGLDDWERCRRLYLLRHLLHLPESDAGPQAHVGTLVHDLLRHLHGRGDCHDPVLRDAVLEDHGQDTRGDVAAMLGRHARRCPAPARSLGHEVTVVRVHREGPPWLATGRLDAVWEHGGVLDVRDYKTGRPRDGSLREDVRARLQAWLATSLARGLPVRVRYEHLTGDEDPDDFEPDAEELARIGTEVAAAVADIRHAAAHQEFPGVGDVELCRTCTYRSVCVDSAAPGEPTWPAPDGDGDPDGHGPRPAGGTS